MARIAVTALVAICGLVIASTVDASPVRTCPSICFCRHTQTVKKADCRDIPEWDLKTSDAQVVRIIPPLHPVPSSPLFLSRFEMFPKVQMLSVTNRSIIELTSGTLPFLQVLDLSHNKISRFNERTFHHMPVLRQLTLAGNPISLKKGISLLVSSSIRTLDLGYSSITIVPNGSLSGIPNLTSLYLQGNPLKLQEGVPLVDRISIQELDLSSCKLTKIPQHSLDNLVNLQRLFLKGNDLKTIFGGAVPLSVHHLDLSANRIRDVPITALTALKNLTRLELAKNPVKCSCDLITFLDRLSEHNVIFERMIVCAEPEKYAKMPWKDINERELCKDDITSEESVGASSEDDSSASTLVSFETDDTSYETDGPLDEENRIISQHPPPLSLQKLLQKPSRYQNMEENSIQSDQPYSNTSDEGTDHTNHPPASTAETVLEEGTNIQLDDDLIVAASTESEFYARKDVSTSTEASESQFEEQLDSNENHMSKGKEETDDSLVVPVSFSSEEDAVKVVSTSTESVEKSSDKHPSEEGISKEKRDSVPIGKAASVEESMENSSEREKLRDGKEKNDDLIKAPDASVAIDEQTDEPPLKLEETSEEQTENPDAETFMRNEETIAMGKMMPQKSAESEDKHKDEHENHSVDNIEKPVLLASQNGGHEDIHSIRPKEYPETLPIPVHQPTEDNTEEFQTPQSDEEDRENNSQFSLEGVSTRGGSTHEISEASTEAVSHEDSTSEDTSQHVLLPVTIAETSHNQSTEKHSTVEEVRSESKDHIALSEAPPDPISNEGSVEYSTTSSEVTSLKTSHDETSYEGLSEEYTSSKPVESSENRLESLGSQELDGQLSIETPYPSAEVGVNIGAGHSDNKTEPVKSQTESAVSSYESGEQESSSPKTDEKVDSNQNLSVDYPVYEPEHKHDEGHEEIEALPGTTESPTTVYAPIIFDKSVSQIVPSSSSNLFDDMDAQMATLFPDTPRTTARHEKPEVTTSAPPETTKKPEPDKNDEGGFSFFPFNILPKSSNTLPSSVSEPGGFPAETSHSDDLTVENNLPRVTGAEDVVNEEGDVHTATMAYAVIASVLVCIVIAVACVSLRTRSDKKRNGSAPVRIRGDTVSPGTEMKDMMNPLLETITEGQTANEFHDDPARRPSLTSIELNDQNGKYPVTSPVPKENGVSDKGRTNGGPPHNSSFKPLPTEDPEVTEVVIEPSHSNGAAGSPVNGLSPNGLSAPVNGKPPRQNGNTANKVKVVAGVIPPAIPRTPVYVKKNIGES